jgi:hypothetical protein
VGDFISDVLKLEADKPDLPPIGVDPGDVPTAEEAALRRRQLMLRGRESLRIDPVAPATGTQIPPPTTT